MIRSRLWLVFVSVMCLAACKSPIAPLTLHDSGTPNVTLPDASRPRDDMTGRDAGTVVPSIDAGTITLPGRDAGRRPPGHIDAGPPSSSCSITISTGIPPLPATCLPRCQASTAQAFNSCTDFECQETVLVNDRTPPVLPTLNGEVQDDPLDCFGCFNFQQTSCAYDSCPSETQALITCVPSSDPTGCDSQRLAVQSCIEANLAAFQPCHQSRFEMCFDF